MEIIKSLNQFCKYYEILSGDEKGEAQIFCERLFQAFGHKGIKEAGAELEFRIKKLSNQGTSYADLVWKPHLLLEMKKRGTKLFLHYKQAFEYWIHAVPNRPRYVALCNFDEFWIYDFDKQIDQPVDKVFTKDLPRRYQALNFLFPDHPEPIFGNDLEEVSREAADKVARLFNSLIKRGIPREQAQRFVLQTVVAMFAEDIGLMPNGSIYSIVDDCLFKSQSSYDLFGSLYSQMNSPEAAKGGRFKNVPYFNGGIFKIIAPIDLNPDELKLIGSEKGASTQDWSKVNPAIFGTIFQQSMDADERHAYGAHFTHECDIMRIINPTIIRPWQSKINKATSIKKLLEIRHDLQKFKILDPACGSGNFLYVAFRELVRLEILLLVKIKENFTTAQFNKRIGSISLINPLQFFGIDRDSFAVELAKVTLMIAKKLALDEVYDALEHKQLEFALQDKALPLDNLDSNFYNDDALFINWPTVDAIIGNPPYQSKNKLQQELGRSYINRVRERFSDIDGRADYCVYWFRKAHDHLKGGQRAGIVGTNTIRQNYSRTGGLDYIVANNGTITEAVSSMKWSGKAVVYVSIVNWIKGKDNGKKRLYIQEDDNDSTKGWRYKDKLRIGPSLSFDIDVTTAKTIKANSFTGGCFQGQTHGHEGFLIKSKEAKELIRNNPENSRVLHPYLIANELIGLNNPSPKRYVIDFYPRDQLEARRFSTLYNHIKKEVLSDRETEAKKEEARNNEAIKANPHARVNRHHHNFLNKWWQLSYPRGEMLNVINSLPRYIVCGCVTKRPIFEFISSKIRPNAALMVFPYADDYSFGILQSTYHWLWFKNRCSTLKGDPRYTSNTVFDTFAWPQNPTESIVKQIASKAQNLRQLRDNLLKKYKLSLRELYKGMENPGRHPLKDAQNELDLSVKEAYKMPKRVNPLDFLLEHNEELVAAESAGKTVTGPGIPKSIKKPAELISKDCISI